MSKLKPPTHSSSESRHAYFLSIREDKDFFILRGSSPRTYGKGRKCRECSTILSMYNPKRTCYLCRSKKKRMDIQEK